jgi:hypothetical protein
MFSCYCPLFDAPQAVKIFAGRPSSRQLQKATESGAVTEGAKRSAAARKRA